MAEVQLPDDHFENDHVQGEPQVLPLEDPALARYRKQQQDALNANKDSAACYWYYFTPQLINGKAAFKCNCCGFVSHSINSSQVMRAHLGNQSCKKKGGSAGAVAVKLITASRKKDEDDRLPADEVARLNAMFGGNTAEKRKRSSMSSYVACLPPSVKDNFKQCIAKWSYECCTTLSFKCLEHPAFKEALQVLGIDGIDRKRVAGPMLDDEYEKIVNNMEKMVAEEKYYQISTDCWKRNLVNDGYKLVGSCLNFPNGGSAFADLLPTSGESLDSNFLKTYLQSVMDKFGASSCISIVADGEKAVQNAVSELEKCFPHMCNFKCQAHCLSLLINDFMKQDKIIAWVLDVAHSMVKIACNNGEFKQEFRAKQKSEKCSRYMRVGVETRFGTRVMELEDVLFCKAAFEETAKVESLKKKLAEGSKATEDAKKVFTYARNENFWAEAEKTLKLLKVIKDAIYLVESDKPLTSQMRKLWQDIIVHTQRWAEEFRVIWAEDAYPWDPAFGAAPPETVPATRFDFKTLVAKRFEYSSHDVFNLAYLLDLRMFNEVDSVAGKVYKPDQSFLSDKEVEGAIALAQRLIGDPALSIDMAREMFVFLDRGIPEDITALKTVEENARHQKFFKYNAQDVRFAWKYKLKRRYPLLTELVEKVLSLHATSCGSERLWSKMRWIYKENRSRLGVERAKKMVFISINKGIIRKMWEDGADEEDGMDFLLELDLDAEEEIVIVEDDPEELVAVD